MRGLRDSTHGENPGVVGLKDTWRYPKFCVNGRGSKCKPKSCVARDEKTLPGYHVD